MTRRDVERTTFENGDIYRTGERCFGKKSTAHFCKNIFGGCQMKHKFKSEIVVGQCFKGMPVQQKDFMADIDK